MKRALLLDRAAGRCVRECQRKGEGPGFVRRFPSPRRPLA